MRVSDSDRLKLAAKASEVFKEEASILMAHLPLGGIENLATKQELELGFAQIRLEMAKGFQRQTTTLLTIMVAVNSVMFAGLKWG